MTTLIDRARERKYVIFADADGNEYPVVFHQDLSHADVNELAGAASLSGWSHTKGRVKAVSAGFVGDSARGSESLQLNPRPQDAALLSSIVETAPDAAILAAEKRGASREREACAQIALAIDSGRGNEKQIAAAIRNRESDT